MTRSIRNIRRSPADDREGFTVQKGRHGFVVAPTVHVVGLSLLFLAPGLVIAVAIEWASATSHDEWALILALAVTVIVGGALWFPTSVGNGLSTRSVFSSVAFSWIACSVVGAVPYAAGSMFGWARFDDALFEAVSGFSATGSTVLNDIERNGAGILMWRQITQFYGGMGMVVLAVTVLPVLGVGGLSLMSAEAPGLSTDRLAPRVSVTARTLWKIYLGITLGVTLLLWAVPGPNLYDSVAHALTTASTGGFFDIQRLGGSFRFVAGRDDHRFWAVRLRHQLHASLPGASSGLHRVHTFCRYARVRVHHTGRHYVHHVAELAARCARHPRTDYRHGLQWSVARLHLQRSNPGVERRVR